MLAVAKSPLPCRKAAPARWHGAAVGERMGMADWLRRLGAGVAFLAILTLPHASVPLAHAEDAPGAPFTAPPELREAISTATDAAREAAEREAVLREQRLRSAREIERLSETIRLSEARRDALEAAVRGIETDEAALRNEAVAAAAERRRLQGALEAAGDRLAVLAVREEELLVGLAERRDVLAEVLAALQRMGRNPPPALLVTPDDALASVRSAILMGAVVPTLRGEAERLVADLTSLKAVRETTVTERERLNRDLLAATEGEERLRLVTEARRESLEKRGRDLVAERARVAELAERASTLEELTATLEAELRAASLARTEAETAKQRAEREAAVAAADAIRRAREDAERFAAAARKPAPSPKEPDEVAEATTRAPGPFARADPDRTAPAFDFASLTGALELPVAGDILRGFGRGGGGVDVRTKGLIVGARPDALVTAPSDAWIDFAGPFRSYGEIVIMNVGGDYRMVLTGLDSSDVAIGQFVLAGEPIGRLGKTDAMPLWSGVASSDPSIYIELRRGAETLDPAPWFRSRPVARAGG